MGAHQQHWIRTAFLSGSTGTVPVGYAVVSNGSAYVVATSANRTSYGRTQGITLTAGDDDDTAIEIQSTGVLLNAVSGLGAGTQSWVRVTALGVLERCTPGVGDDLVGTCNTRGDVYLDLGKWTSANYAGGGGGASLPINLATDVTGTLPEANQADQTMGGDVSGATSAAVVEKVKGTTITTAGGALAVGAVLRTTAVGTADWGAANLADSDAVTGTLPIANGGTGASSLAAGLIQSTGGAALSTTGLGTGLQLMRTNAGANGVEWWTLSVNLGTQVTGSLPIGSVGAPTGTGVATVTSGAWDAASTGTSGTGNFARVNTPTFVTPVLGAATGTSVALSSFASVGGTVASTGSVRLADESTVYANSGGTNYRLFYFTAGNLNIGESGAGVSNLVMYGQSSITLAIGSTTMALIDSTGFRLNDGGGQYYTFAPSNIAANRTITLPLLTGNDTMVCEAHAQTLTNKTISLTNNTLTFTSAQLRTACSDETGTGSLVFATAPSFSSYIQIQSTETGDAVQVGNNLWIVGQRAAGGKTYIASVNTSNELVLGTSANPGNTHVIAGTGFNVNITSGTTTAAEFGATAAVLHSATLTTKASAVRADGNTRCKPYSDIANVQTTDATVTTLFSFTPTDEAVTLVTAEVLAANSTGATTNSYVRRCKVKRDGGTVTVGTVEESFNDEDAPAWNCTIDNSGTTVRVRVTGAAATTIDWGGVVTRLEVSHA